MRTLLIGMALGLAACGSQSPTAQVRATEVKAVAALASDHPEDACQYMVPHDACIKSVVTLKALNLDTRAVVGIPDDWRARVDRARIVVHGNTATLSPGPRGKVGHFVRRDGRWFAVNS